MITLTQQANNSTIPTIEEIVARAQAKSEAQLDAIANAPKMLVQSFRFDSVELAGELVTEVAKHEDWGQQDVSKNPYLLFEASNKNTGQRVQLSFSVKKGAKVIFYGPVPAHVADWTKYGLKASE